MNQYSTDLYDTAVTRHYQVLFMDMVLALNVLIKISL